MPINLLEKLNSKLMEVEKTVSSASPHVFKKIFDSMNQARVTIRDYLKNPIPQTPISQSTFRKPFKETSKVIPQTVIETPIAAEKLHPEINSAIEKASLKYQVPRKMIESIIKAESNFNPKARSPVGAMGLMQLMPMTAHELGVKNAYDIHENINAGVKYFRKMLDRFGQSSELALAAYNAGQGNVIRYGGIPPYRETQNYVSKIMKNYNSAAV